MLQGSYNYNKNSPNLINIQNLHPQIMTDDQLVNSDNEMKQHKQIFSQTMNNSDSQQANNTDKRSITITLKATSRNR